MCLFVKFSKNNTVCTLELNIILQVNKNNIGYYCFAFALARAVKSKSKCKISSILFLTRRLLSPVVVRKSLTVACRHIGNTLCNL